MDVVVAWLVGAWLVGILIAIPVALAEWSKARRPRRARAAPPPDLRVPPTSLDWMISPAQLAFARSEEEARALRAVLGALGYAPIRPVELRGLRLEEAELVALLAIVAADPRVSAVRLSDGREALAVAQAYARFRATQR